MTAVPAWLLRVVLIPLIAYAVVVALLLVFEKRLVFFPQFPGRLSGDWSPSDLDREEVWITAADGVRLSAWWVLAPSNTTADLPTFLCLHGNASNIAERADVYRFLRRLPANVLAVEYRGYGRSEGAPSEDGLYRDADAAYMWLARERGIPPRRILVLGQSLGTAVAAQLASQREVGGVVLEAPFPSARSLARRIYWFLPGLSWFIRSRFETTKNLEEAHRRFHSSLLVIHCTQDPVIPFAFGREVFDAAAEPKFFLAVAGPCHEEASFIDPESVRRALLAFVSRVQDADYGGRPR